MALSTKGLVAPDSVGSLDASRVAPSGGTSGPLWAVGDPAAVAMAGLQKSAERFADTYNDVQVGDFIMRQKKRLDDLYDNPDTGLFATRKGDAAKGMYQESKDTFKTIWDEDAKQQLSERQRQLASKPLQAMFMDYAHRIGSHETTQLMNAQVERAENTISTARDLVAAGKVDMETLGSALANIEIATAAQGRMLGWDSDTVSRKQKEAFGSAIIKGSAAIAATNPTMAIGVLNKYRGFISDADYQASLGVLDEKARDFKKQHYLELVASGQKEEADSFLRNNAPQGMSITGNTIASNNFGNVKNSSGGYNSYATRKDGLMAIGERVLRYNNAPERGWNAQTLFDMVSIYAPKGDGKNNPEEYAAFLGKKLGVDPNAKIDFRDPKVLAGLIQYMPVMEQGAGKVNISQAESMEAAQSLLDGEKPKVSGTATTDNPHSPAYLAGNSKPDAGAESTAGYRPGTGMLKPSEVMTLLKHGKEMFGRQQEDAAFKFVADMPQSKALEMLSSPDGQMKLGIDAKQAAEVSNMLNTHWTHKNAAEKRTRDDYDRDALTRAVNLAFGVGGGQADPDAAYKTIRDDPNIDGKTKLETLKALQNGTLDTDDPGFVVDIKKRIANGQPVTEADIARGVATGRLSFATKEKLIKLQETAQGPQGTLVKYAFNALDGAFKKSMLADGTPEQALAHFAAQRELQDAIEQAQAKGNVLDLLNPQSKNYILPGIMQRHQLTMSDQVSAIRNKMSAQPSGTAKKPVEDANTYLQRRMQGAAQ